GVRARRHATHPPPAQVRADREAARELPAAARAVATPYALEPPDETERRTRVERLKRLLGERIVLLDGAMGTMIQGHKLDERGFRGERLREHGRDLRGNNDILTLTRPQIITDIHRAYLAAGTDIIETNTFNSNAISQADYATGALVPELNYRAARLARAAADEFAQRAGEARFVAGALGGRQLRPYVGELAAAADTYVCAYPNAGLPNAFGEYDEGPAETADILREYGESGLVNVVGGCCGTTPEHIRLLHAGLQGRAPRRLAAVPVKCRLAGLEPLNIDDDSLFVNVGERTNVTGSAKF